MNNFVRGMITAWAAVSLYQDLVWKTADRYAAYILDNGWIDRRVSIPLALISLVVVWAVGRLQKGKR